MNLYAPYVKTYSLIEGTHIGKCNLSSISTLIHPLVILLLRTLIKSPRYLLIPNLLPFPSPYALVFFQISVISFPVAYLANGPSLFMVNNSWPFFHEVS